MQIDRKELAGIFAEAANMPAGTVSAKTAISELQDWDSLSVLALITDVDAQYGVVLDPKALLKCTSVEEVAQLVDSMRAGAASSAAA